SDCNGDHAGQCIACQEMEKGLHAFLRHFRAAHQTRARDAARLFRLGPAASPSLETRFCAQLDLFRRKRAYRHQVPILERRACQHETADPFLPSTTSAWVVSSDVAKDDRKLLRLFESFYEQKSLGAALSHLRPTRRPG